MKQHIATRYTYDKVFCGKPMTNLNVTWSDAVNFVETRLPKKERINKNNWRLNCKKTFNSLKIEQLTEEKLREI